MAENKKSKTTKKKSTKPKKTTKKATAKEAAPKVAEIKITETEEVREQPAVVAAPETVSEETVVAKPKKVPLPKGQKYYGTGRRKEAIAKVWLKAGSGNFVVNGKGLMEYFCGRKLLEYQVLRPLRVTNTLANYDVFVRAYGGGIPGQAGAVSMGIARALLEVSPDFRVKLKREGLLRRDPRMKERKKYGLKRARKAFQYTKR
ncbi:MAG: 30S ribosomal protein S9 [Candidatus Margulisbacteria bacterium]|nr:30S ribosomal protein S9 [Candidatus Margulisiibacteriota bacterium]